MQYYLFQLDEASAVDIMENYLDGDGTMTLPFRQQHSVATPGDRVVLWLQDRDARAFAVAELTEFVPDAELPRNFRRPEAGMTRRPAFEARFLDMLDRDVYRSTLRREDTFARFPFRQANVRNPFVLTRDQYDVVVRLGGFEEAEADTPGTPAATPAAAGRS